MGSGKDIRKEPCPICGGQVVSWWVSDCSYDDAGGSYCTEKVSLPPQPPDHNKQGADTYT
jgi:hypothetical protein